MQLVPTRGSSAVVVNPRLPGLYTAHRSPINIREAIAKGEFPSGPLPAPDQPPPAPSPAPPPPYTGYGNEPLETPASGNIAPSTDPYAYIDPATGDLVASTPGTATFDAIKAWVQSNPMLALGLAATAVFLLMEMFGGDHSRRHRR